ncbi:MAG: HAD-IC family P-type ATPase [Chloroflexota bacterium]|nr:HAD-IC family P-type ATPase [Chloroflexota bacterium]
MHDESLVWHELTIDETAKTLGVDPAIGLSGAEASERLQTYGPNQLAEEETEPRWRAFLRQYRDYMQIVLLGAALVSLLAIQDIATATLLVLLTIFNAIMGMRQEAKAEASLASLKEMLQIDARVRREGQITEIPAEELVPGDVVLFEAGDRIPADGRLSIAAALEIEESALTGESTPVAKSIDPVTGDDVPLGDRIDMAYMQSSVTRGRGEMLVTGTGMNTEVGNIAGMLQKTEVEKTPLTKQIDRLTLMIAGLAALALVAIVVIGLARGETIDELFVVGISLAIAAIPTGMPVVITTMLSIGTSELAQRNAIVKRLPAVETLGSTSAICSDKTGTLTLNQMTAQTLFTADFRLNVTGEGYDTTGQIQQIGGQEIDDLGPVLMPMALASDAVVKDGELIGDPTEGALVVLASKGGLDVEGTRQAYPRIAEVPFDSAYKLMATFHNMTDNGKEVVRCYVKGAPDVLTALSSHSLDRNGQLVDLDDERKARVMEGNDLLASEGMRVMMVAQKDFDPRTFDANSDDLLSKIEGLSLLGMAGIVDPPRPEARDAIAECKSAGIQVRMITGDHATTAAAIGSQLGIEGRAITGAEFEHMSDQEAKQEIDGIGVIARVAPEHKVRLVKILQEKGNIVAMTGDGVNDAPALKNADIGVAMGITGTDVSKDSAAMILTDDNFATIVVAVEQGRGIYDNLLKYIRFQMATLMGFILTFLGSSLFDVAGTAFFAPLQILWVNFLVDAPIGMALGFDTPSPGLMDRKPRPASDPLVGKRMGARLILVGFFMAAITLATYTWAETRFASAMIAQTMALITFSLSHLSVALNLRHPTETVFRDETFSNKRLLLTYGFVILMAVLVTELPLFQNIFDTTSLTGQQWVICIAVAVSMLFLGEIGKWIIRLVMGESQESEV